ncbi:hypothetical protein CDD80_3088 [Ophiocordyceps camponoti-rufipedis]|uniref:ADF-H domain-containing protein n=1 Tax=Ophiocordyceps camponoti-rufipedis TaxID=2004952 RepID=A0A2C5Z090_9HYPO|nr:hypothetical protein CDD80_3088 [Ophiocordyceps camponoti-rufipedis]
MSLNGLDGAAILEAHETVTAEVGGWLLLKYSDRDEVELLSRGNGGVVEMRKAVADYDETSPLYGFLKYRRRSVVVKHLPPDCSRLIQARVAVHFNAVCEHFSPYDAIFEIESASDLKDVKLSAACSLHAASCSTSSSTSSLRRRRLMEIAEEDEEQRASKRHSQDSAAVRPSSQDRAVADPVALNSQLAAFPENSEFSATSTSEVPNFVGLDQRPTSSARSSDVLDPFSSYPYKPKVKLGPRPSLDVGGRPRTAGTFRPISAIPAGFKLFGRGNKKASTDKTHDAYTADGAADEKTASFDYYSVTPEEPFRTKTDVVRPVTSSGVSAAQATRQLPQTPRKAAMSSEKARLIKAMQLRQKKMLAASTTAATHESSVPEGVGVQSSIAEVAEDAAEADQTQTAAEALPHTEAADQISDLTHSDSRPASPVVALSEAEQSTKASSVSESTDDTAREKCLDAVADVEERSKVPAADEEVDETAVQREAVLEEGGLEGGLNTGGPTEDEMNPIGSAALDETTVSSGTPRITPLPVSKFSIDPPLSPREAPTSGHDCETLDDQRTAHTGGETADVDESVASPAQWKSPDSHVSTLYSPDSKVASPLLQRALKTDSLDKSPNVVQPRRNKAHVEPIRTDLAYHSRHTSHSGVDFSDDDDLMEELQSATLQEAKPMVVKTPLSATFSTGRPGLNAQPAHMVRTISNPVRGSLNASSDGGQSARSVSTGPAFLRQVTQQPPPQPQPLLQLQQQQQQQLHLQKQQQQQQQRQQQQQQQQHLQQQQQQQQQQQLQAAILAKKSNIGTGISQRIKALEKLTAGSGDGQNSRERPSSAFYAVKKREQSRPPSVADGTASLFLKSVSGSRPQSKDSSSEPGTPNRRERFETEHDFPSLVDLRRAHGESVSVTARIVRDGGDGFENGRLELKQSPLWVDHHRAASDAMDLSEEERGAKGLRARPSSLSMVKDFITKERRKSVASSSGDGRPSSASMSPPLLQSSSFSPRMSMSSRRSSFNRDSDGPVSSPGEGDDGKKLSRTGRFMRRLSTLSGSRSKSSLADISDAVAEEREATTTTVSYVGDVNVQFPDTLLWKRRNLGLDSRGFLVLGGLPAQSGRQGQGSKRYHLGQFRRPYVPDVEVQELPFSVVLDFVEGASIQVACEDRAGQAKVLSFLREAHAGQGLS